MNKYLSVGEMAEFCGVCIKTLHRWEMLGVLMPSYRTPGGHRRYDRNEARRFCGFKDNTVEKATLLYSRVSSADQKQDLARQTQKLKDYTQQQNIVHTISLSDIGSGMNFNKKGLLSLLKHLFSGAVNKIIVTPKDRLMRFGFALIEKICQYLSVEIIVMDSNDKESDFTTQLTQDLIEIITVFSAKLYGRRSSQNRINTKETSETLIP